MFINAARQEQIQINFSPSPSSYLLVGNSQLEQNNLPRNNGASGMMFSKETRLLFTDFGDDFDFRIIRDDKVFAQKTLRNGCCHLQKGRFTKSVAV